MASFRISRKKEKEYGLFKYKNYVTFFSAKEGNDCCCDREQMVKTGRGPRPILYWKTDKFARFSSITIREIPGQCDTVKNQIFFLYKDLVLHALSPLVLAKQFLRTTV